MFYSFCFVQLSYLCPSKQCVVVCTLFSVWVDQCVWFACLADFLEIVVGLASAELVTRPVCHLSRCSELFVIFSTASLSFTAYLTQLLYTSATWMRFCTSQPLMGRLKPHSNGPLYRNTVVGTLAVDGWVVTFGTARKGLSGLPSRPVPSSMYQM